jgi:hypothetical protein
MKFFGLGAHSVDRASGGRDGQPERLGVFLRRLIIRWGPCNGEPNHIVTVL